MKVYLLFLMCVFGGIKFSIADEINSRFFLTERKVVLARLMSREWVDNKYYSYEDFKKIGFVSFKGMSLSNDGKYYDYIDDQSELTVNRLTESIFGSREDVVKLTDEQFWMRVFYVDFLFRKGDLNNMLPIDLYEVEVWWRKNQINRDREIKQNLQDNARN